MQKILTKLGLLGLCVAMVGCAFTSPSRKAPSQNASGFLPDYKLLSAPVESGNITVYRYVNPNINRSDYHAVIIDPIHLYQPTGSKTMSQSVDESSIDSYRTSKVTKEQLKETESVLDTYIREMVSQKFNVVTTPGKGVAKLSVAITGAEIDKDGLRVINLMPISAAIKVASAATGIDNKRAVLIIEAKVVDSKSGELLGEAYNIVSGEKFRNEIKTSEQFQELAKNWVDMSIKFAASNRANVNVRKNNIKVNSIDPQNVETIKQNLKSNNSGN